MMAKNGTTEVPVCKSVCVCACVCERVYVCWTMDKRTIEPMVRSEVLGVGRVGGKVGTGGGGWGE